jgi:hypothetical protein
MDIEESGFPFPGIFLDSRGPRLEKEVGDYMPYEKPNNQGLIGYKHIELYPGIINARFYNTFFNRYRKKIQCLFDRKMAGPLQPSLDGRLANPQFPRDLILAFLLYIKGEDLIEDENQRQGAPPKGMFR